MTFWRSGRYSGVDAAAGALGGSGVFPTNLPPISANLSGSAAVGLVKSIAYREFSPGADSFVTGYSRESAFHTPTASGDRSVSETMRKNPFSRAFSIAVRYSSLPIP